MMKNTYYGRKHKQTWVKNWWKMLLIAVLFFAAGFIAARFIYKDPALAAEDPAAETSKEESTEEIKEDTGAIPADEATENEHISMIAQYRFEESEKILDNPYIGLGAWADAKESKLKQNISLVYVDVTWKELEPEKGVFAFEELEERCRFDYWISEGKHAVFRFVLDEPDEEAHMDIPDWLYKITGDGKFYNTDYGKGYCPDYNNEALIAEHERVITALGERYAGSEFIEYIQLGSIGHWGEWHIHEDAGKMPSMEICSRYYSHYKIAFPEDQLMLRRPFAFASEDQPGLYNDSAGHISRTEEWLDWIRNGGEYQDTKEQDALSPMPDAWRYAAIGGELSSSLTDTENMTRMLTEDLQQTLELFKRSHTSWIAPGSFAKLDTSGDEQTQEGLKKLLNIIGYRIYVSEICRYRNEDSGEEYLEICLQNSGVAPFYKEWTIQIRKSYKDGKTEIIDSTEDIRKLTADSPLYLKIDWETKLSKLEIKLCEPQGRQRIKLANDLPEEDGWMLLWENTD